jgi:hypothetical protein
LIYDHIRQTRCTTCESEHVFKEAKVPKRRRKDEPASLYEQVLADVEPPARAPAAPVASEPPRIVAAASDADDRTAAEPVEPAAEAGAEPDDAVGAESQPEASGGAEEPWFGHRRLIRASLPKTDAEPAPRPIPEFTMHQRQTRGGHHFRHGQFGQSGNGSGPNGFRHGHGRSGHGPGQGPPQGPGGRPHRGGRGRRRGGNKRPR